MNLNQCVMFCIWTNICLFFQEKRKITDMFTIKTMIYLLTLHCYMAPSNSFFCFVFSLCPECRDSSTAKGSYWSQTWSHGKPRKDLLFFYWLQLFVLVNIKAPWVPYTCGLGSHGQVHSCKWIMECLDLTVIYQFFYFRLSTAMLYQILYSSFKKHLHNVYGPCPFRFCFPSNAHLNSSLLKH